MLDAAHHRPDRQHRVMPIRNLADDRRRGLDHPRHLRHEFAAVERAQVAADKCVGNAPHFKIDPLQFAHEQWAILELVEIGRRKYVLLAMDRLEPGGNVTPRSEWFDLELHRLLELTHRMQERRRRHDVSLVALGEFSAMKSFGACTAYFSTTSAAPAVVTCHALPST